MSDPVTLVEAPFVSSFFASPDQPKLAMKKDNVAPTWRQCDTRDTETGQVRR
jgi:hypothetical protein